MGKIVTKAKGFILRVRHNISKCIQQVFRKPNRRVQIGIYGSLGALIIFTALFFSGTWAQFRSIPPTPTPDANPQAAQALILKPHPTQQQQSIEPPIASHQPSPTPVPTKKPTPPPVKRQPTTPPAPTQPPAPSGSVQEMIYQVFGPTYGPGALNVAKCESDLNPNAYNATSIGGSHAAGLFQILYPSTWATTPQGRAGLSPYNAQANIQAAHNIFVRDGYSWREWVCQP